MEDLWMSMRVFLPLQRSDVDNKIVHMQKRAAGKFGRKRDLI